MPLLSSLLSNSATFCRGTVLFFWIEFLKVILIYHLFEARLDQSQLFYQASILIKAAACFLTHEDYMGFVDIERLRVFVKPNELVESDLAASQSESLKVDVWSEELHLSYKLRNFKDLISANLARDLIFLTDVIRADHNL